MAIQFDISKVAMFRNAVLANNDTMANLDGNGGIKSAGQYRGVLSQPMSVPRHSQGLRRPQ